MQHLTFEFHSLNDYGRLIRSAKMLDRKSNRLQSADIVRIRIATVDAVIAKGRQTLLAAVRFPCFGTAVKRRHLQ